MRTIEQLIEAVREEALRADFPVDTPVYQRSGKDPHTPVLFAGTLTAPVCVFARDLGKDEVAAGQPLIGAGGRLVRSGVYRAATGQEPPASDRDLMSVLDHVLLTNTVPYKPPGNKAYSNPVKERFRPFLAELLVDHWKGDRVITLGTEAYQWFTPYVRQGQEAAEFWRREDRYEAELDCSVVSGDSPPKSIRLLPLPHPSPLNQRWYGLFPGLLARRLSDPPSMPR